LFCHSWDKLRLSSRRSTHPFRQDSAVSQSPSVKSAASIRSASSKFVVHDSFLIGGCTFCFGRPWWMNCLRLISTCSTPSSLVRILTLTSRTIRTSVPGDGPRAKMLVRRRQASTKRSSSDFDPSRPMFFASTPACSTRRRNVSTCAWSRHIDAESGPVMHAVCIAFTSLLSWCPS